MLSEKQWNKQDWIDHWSFQAKSGGFTYGHHNLPRTIRNINIKLKGRHPISSSEHEAMEAWRSWIEGEK